MRTFVHVCERVRESGWLTLFTLRMKLSISSLLVFYDFLLKLNIIVLYEKICEHRLSAARVGMSSHVFCLEVGERVGLSEK